MGKNKYSTRQRLRPDMDGMRNSDGQLFALEETRSRLQLVLERRRQAAVTEASNATSTPTTTPAPEASTSTSIPTSSPMTETSTTTPAAPMEEHKEVRIEN